MCDSVVCVCVCVRLWLQAVQCEVFLLLSEVVRPQCHYRISLIQTLGETSDSTLQIDGPAAHEEQLGS